MTRKLLPYEHQIVDALGITKEEYLEFVALYEYKDLSGTPVAAETVAIVLTIVGILFQVAAVLLAPKPQIPEVSGGGQPQTRDERFAPRFGFNNIQELAAYGDPVNLVYANRGKGSGANPNGGVRLTSSLLWSAVRSYGSSQYIQMLLMLAGGAITSIDIDKSAFGQTPLRDLAADNIWMYFNPGGTGILRRKHELFGKEATDPIAQGGLDSNPYRIQPNTRNIRVDGFSEAYSPTTANTVGVYSPIPLNILLFLRDKQGVKKSTDLEIEAKLDPWVNKTSQNITVGTQLEVSFAKTTKANEDEDDVSDIRKEARDARRALSSSLDLASTYKLGSALFRVTSISGAFLDEKTIKAKLECIQAGKIPSVSYASRQPSKARYTASATYIKVKAAAEALLDADEHPNIETAQQLYDYGYIRKAKTKIVKEYGTVDEATVVNSRGGRRLKDGWYSEQVLTRAGYQFYYYQLVTKIKGYKKTKLTEDQLGTLARYIKLELDDASTDYRDDIFYTKALVKVAIARYETISPSHIIDFALKARVFKRITGRQLEYGSKQVPGYPASDNGIKTRVSLFKVRYKETGRNTYKTIPAIFAINRAADNDNFVYFRFNSNLTDANPGVQFTFELEPISDPLAEHEVNQNYIYLDNFGEPQSYALSSYTLQSGSKIQPTIEFTGSVPTKSGLGLPPRNDNPKDLNEWDLFNYDSDTQLSFSFDNGPEIALLAVTEQLRQKFDDYTNTETGEKLYDNLSLFGFNAYSGKSIQDLRSLSVFVEEGRKVRRIKADGTYPARPDGPSSLAPDIFLDTILDKEDGIGKYAVVDAVDVAQLAKTKKFCEKNGLFMDCVIADLRNWREFWVEVAPYNLLEFARVGGRETLVPAVPYNPTTGAITRTVNVSAIFNQGNILEDSYKEEYLDYGSNVQDVIATVIYTDNSDSNDSVFARKRSVEIQRSDTVETDAIRQTFDLSSYVSNEAQAILFGKLICNTRRYIRQAIEFKTFPTSSPISPGAFIYVDIGQNSWDAIRTGVIANNGRLNTPVGSTPANGTYNFRLYRSDKGLINKDNITVTDGVASALSNYEGYLFVLGVETTVRRVFRVSEVQMDEEGETTVRASSYPCTADGKSLLADFSSNLFTVRS